jgi:Glycine transporter
LFAVTGAQKAIDHRINPLMAAIMGMLTGIGGGMTRDVLAGNVPFVLRGDLYALAALAGGAIVSIGDGYGCAANVSDVVGGGCLYFPSADGNLSWLARACRPLEWRQGKMSETARRDDIRCVENES